MYSSNSTLILNGTNVFMNSTASVPSLYNLFSEYYNNIIDAICNHGTGNYPKMRFNTASAYGGAILCSNCTLQINEYSTFKSNATEYGGAIVGLYCWISIHDSTLFDGNSAYAGGAMYLKDTNLIISGNVSIVNNSAAYGGAIHISDTNISFNMDTTSESKVSEILVDGSSSMVVFRQSIASQVGGAIESHANNVLIFTGTVKFIDNSALKNLDFEIWMTPYVFPVYNSCIGKK